MKITALAIGGQYVLTQPRPLPGIQRDSWRSHERTFLN